MKSRAELLAEIEEKRRENKVIPAEVNEFSIAEPEAVSGYDPYDNPGLGKQLRGGADIVARRRGNLTRTRRR
jgi:hypothetical protein